MNKLKEIDLHVTNRCNLNCIHCSLDSNKWELPEIDIEQIVNCLDDAVKLGLKELHITGGEPLLREDIFEIIKQAKKRKLIVQLQTNGTLLNDGIIERLKSYSVDWVMISIDGASKQTNNWIRRGNYNYESLFLNIKKLLSKKIRVRINTVILKRNEKEILKLLKKTMNMNINLHSFFYFSPMGRARNLWSEWLSPSDWIKLANKVRNLYISLSNKSSTKVIFEKGYVFSPEELANLGLNCRIQKRDFCFIRCDGEIFPCVLFSGSNSYSLGNITQEKFISIWKNSKKWEIYKNAINHECKRCEYFQKCKGGCKGFSYLKTSNLYCRDPRCKKEVGIFPACPVINSDLKSWREFKDQTKLE